MTATNDNADLFDQPALKLYAKQLNFSEWSDDQSCWLVTLKHSSGASEKKIPTRLVWLQGTILNVINASCLIMKDVSGIVKITNCDRIAGGTDWVKKGLYCYVIGEIVSTSNTPCVNASKMTSLDNYPHLQSLWAWEIEDLADILSGFST